MLSVKNKGFALDLHKSTETWYGKVIRTFHLQKFLTVLHKKKLPYRSQNTMQKLQADVTNLYPYVASNIHGRYLLRLFATC